MTEYIHYNPDRTEYSVSEEELNSLANGKQPLWKDVCIASTSLGIPTLINAIGNTVSQKEFALDLPMLLNYLFGIIGMALGIIFGIAWYRSRKKTKSLIDCIKSKPRIELPASTTNVGALEGSERK